VQVNFDLYPDPKYDEVYDVNSNKLQPLYTHSKPPETIKKGRNHHHRHHGGAAPVNGAVGLVNLGNTCYITRVEPYTVVS
jgi:sugar/nucleoside kinase (ribokinase family)